MNVCIECQYFMLKKKRESAGAFAKSEEIDVAVCTHPDARDRVWGGARPCHFVREEPYCGPNGKWFVKK